MKQTRDYKYKNRYIRAHDVQQPSTILQENTTPIQLAMYLPFIKTVLFSLITISHARDPKGHEYHPALPTDSPYTQSTATPQKP